MKVYAQADEWFPVYHLEESREQEDKSWSRHVELDGALVDRYRKAQKAFHKVRIELDRAMDDRETDQW